MPGFAHSLAIIIGIDAYGHGIPPLRTAVNDARRVAQILEQDHGYDVHLLVEDVTRARLEALFTQTLHVGPDDRLLVYFAGHGIALDGDDGPAGYLIPQDARPEDRDTFLPMLDLHNWLDALPCRHLLAVLDCCFAGAFRWASTRNLIPIPDVIHQERYERFIRDPAWQVITSAAYDQRALDVLAGDVLGQRGEREEHSPFALALFEALAGAGDVVPAGGGDGVITATELYLYLRDKVEVQVGEQARHRQTPGLWPLKKHDKGEYILLVPGHELNLPPAPELTAGLNPWRGLRSYDEEHCQLFFGREDEIDELAELVAKQPFTAVLGASGTGKSSLVKAGLLPRLRGCAEDGMSAAAGESPWFILPPLRPTATPLGALHQTLRQELPGLHDVKGLDRLRDDADALAELLAAWPEENRSRRLLLVVDQLEELVTLCRDDDEREQFLALLARAVEQEPEIFRLVITLRTDFEPQFDETTPLASFWHDARYVVPPMDQADLRQVIEGPASVRVLYFEPPELADALITEVIQTPGALPLLSFTLSELYIRYLRSRRDNRALAQEDFDALGGVIGSLRNRANEECEALPDDDHRETMRRVMLRMVSVEGGELARRRVQRSELVYPDERENQRVDKVLDRLVQARLLVTGKEEGEATVEPAHDALMLAWDRLLRWKKEAEQYLPLQRRLAQAATEWSKARPEARSGLLWDNDPRLPQLEETLWPTGGKQKGLRGRIRWARQILAPNTDTPPGTRWLNGAEVTFVQASVQARAKFWQRTIGLAFTVFVIVGILLAFGFNQQQQSVANAQAADTKEALRAIADLARATAVAAQAETERLKDQIRGEQLGAEVQNALSEYPKDPSLALILSREAIEATWKPTVGGFVPPAVYDAAIAAIAHASPPVTNFPPHRHGDAVNSVYYSPDASSLITASDDGTAQVWDTITWERILLIDGHAGEITSARYNDQGTRIVTTSLDGTAKIWNAETGEALLSVQSADGVFQAASFSHGGDQLVTAGSDGVARVWAIATGQEQLVLASHEGPLFAALFGPEDETIATAGQDGWVRIWDAASGVQQIDLQVAEGSVHALAFRGTTQLVTGAADGLIIIWDIADQGWSQALIMSECANAINPSDACPIYTVAVSQDGSRLVATARFSAYVWQMPGQIVLFQETGIINSAAIRNDGAEVAVAYTDGTARIWDVETGQVKAVLGGHSLYLGSISISPDGARLLTDGRNTPRIWDIETGHLRSILRFGFSDAAFSPDGIRIASVNSDGRVTVWDSETGDILQQMPGHDCGEANCPHGYVAYSSDGTLIVTATGDEIQVWDTSTYDLLRTITPTCESSYGCFIGGIGLNPDNTHIAASTRDKANTVDPTIRVWDIGNGEELLAYVSSGGSDIQYSPDGNRIVNIGNGLRIHDAHTGEELLAIEFQNGRSVAFSPDGNRIVTTAGVGNTDGVVQVWDANDGHLQVEFCCGLHAAFDPDGTYLVTQNGPGAKIWELGHEPEPTLLQSHPDTTVPENLSSIAYSSDGQLIASGDFNGWVQIWDAASGEALLTRQQDNGVSAIAFSPDSQSIAAAQLRGSVTIWDIETGRQVGALDGHENTVHSVSYSPDGTQIITAGSDGTVRIWDAIHKTELKRFVNHAGETTAAAFRPGGQQVAGADQSGVIRIWEMETGQLVRELTAHEGGILDIAYNVCGDQVASAGDDGLVRIWDADTGESIQTLAGHIGPVNALSFGRTGRYLASGGEDNTVKVWDLTRQQEIASYEGHARAVVDVAFNPDGTKIVSAGWDFTPRIWYAHPDLLLQAIEDRISRQPPVLTLEERKRYGVIETISPASNLSSSD